MPKAENRDAAASCRAELVSARHGGGLVGRVRAGDAYRSLEGILEQIQQLLAGVLVVSGDEAEDGPGQVHGGGRFAASAKGDE